MSNKNKTQLSIFPNNCPFKIYLSFYISVKELNEINNNIKIISKYEELKKIIDLNEPQLVKFLYFNKHYSHQILYEEEEIIFITSYENKKNLYYTFYLSLLIMENPSLINYSYEIDYIREINNEYKNIKDKYKSIVISKIILILINNYDENKNAQELIKIKEEREEIIKSNIIIFKEMNLDLNEDYIKTKKIDEIYIEIIYGLIKSKKIDDYNYTYNIINQLDLENINITKTMFNEISKILDSNNNEYIITKVNDLNNENKINFYYIILKYILKDTIYIYQIPSLLKTRKLFLKSLKSNQLLNINNNNIKYKFILHFLLDSDYYFQTIPDSDLNKLKEILNYYKKYGFKSKKEEIDIIENIVKNKKGFYQKYLKDYDEYKNKNKIYSIIKIKNENIKDLDKNEEEELYKNEINTDDIEKEKNGNNQSKDSIKINIQNNIINSNNEKNKSISSHSNELKISDFSRNSFIENISYSKHEIIDILEPNINKNISFYNDIKNDIEKILKKSNYTININKKNLYNIDFFDLENLSKYDEEYYINMYERINIFLKKNKNKKFEEEFENLIENFKKLKEFIQTIKEKFKTKAESHIDSIIKLYFEESKEKSNGKYRNINCKYIINNVRININENNNLYQDEDILNSEKQKNFDKLLSQLDFIYSLPFSIISLNSLDSQESLNYNNFQFERGYKILEFIKTIGKHKEYGQFIIELSNGIIISSGKKSLYFYDGYDGMKKLELELRLQNNYICELGNDNDKIILAICSNKGIYKALLKKNNKIDTVFNNENENYRFCLNLKKTSIICTENGVFDIENLFEKIFRENKYKINDKNFWGGIKINQNIIAFTSNKILPNGNDEIIIYNINSKKNIDIIKGYSFILSHNNLTIMPRKETKNIILLCACKKYIKGQKNGILLLTLKIDNNVIISKRFYETGNFEVYCFCPIIICDDLNNIILNKKENKVKNSKYFLIGGFDCNKGRGLIKLYKVKYKKNFENTQIEYIQNVEITKYFINDSNCFNGFKGPITCIKQPLKKKYIIVICLDGSVFLLYLNISSFEE